MPRSLDDFKQDNLNQNDTAAPPDHTPVSDGTVYGEIKRFESQFPVPAPQETIFVGTLDPFNGSFDSAVSIPPEFPLFLAASGPQFPDGLDSTLFDDIEDFLDADRLPDPLPPPLPTDPLIVINAVTAILEFRITAPQDALNVTVKGITVTAPAGAQSVLINVGAATTVNWVFSSGTATVHGRLLIRRPPVVGAGAFVIPALPVGIVYDPPVDQAKKNTALLGSSNSVGVRTANSFSNDTSSSTPVRGRYQSILDLQAGMNALAVGLNNLQDPSAKAAAKGLEFVSGALGSASSSQTVGTKISDSESLDIGLTNSEVFTADTHQGPGIGDRIIYLEDVQLVWLAGNGQLRLSMLGHGQLRSPTVQMLKEDRSGRSTVTGLDAQTIDALLALDPFAADAQAAPPQDRFSHHKTYGIDGTLAASLSQSTTSTDQQAVAEYRSRIDDSRKGFLSYLGIGISETETVKTVITVSDSTQVSQSQTVTATVQFFAAPGEHYSVEVYYDRVFSSFAFRKIIDAAQPYLTGVLTSPSGTFVSGQEVTLQQSGRRYAAVSGAKGRYAFSASTLDAGEAELSSGSFKQTVTLRPNTAVLQVNIQM